MGEDFLGNALFFALTTNYLAGNPVGVNSELWNDLRTRFAPPGTTIGGATNLGQVIIAIVQILLVVAGSMAVIFLIWGGYKYIIARGNEDEVESAKKTISGAIIGLVVVILSFAIVSIISNILIAGRTGIP